MEQAGKHAAPDRFGIAARRAAWRAVAAVLEDGRLLSETLPAELAPLAPPDRARAGRLATESLRWAGRADRVLGPYLRKRPAPRVHAMLRMAVWEICGDGSAAHGVVNAAVEILSADRGTRGQAGLANAVLRRVAEADPDWHALPLPELPKWLRKPLLAAYGKPVVTAIEAAHAAGAPLDLTPGPAAPKDLARRLGADTLPTGSLRLDHPGQVSALPGYAEGWWWVQDAAAAVPARLLRARPGERVLDLCAAPGGKTLQIAATGAEVTALDVSEARLSRLRENLERTGLAARVVVADALDWAAPEPYDAALLDAPCSATGTIRRHPDLPHARDGSGVAGLVALQARLIDRAVGVLRPGGRLVYCTCSLLREEGEDQVRAALYRHPGLEVDRQALSAGGIEPEWTSEVGLRTRPDFWPERGGMDGFFAALLRKPA